MLDARAIPGGEELSADYCIIGAGPAGLTLALELVGSGADVLIVEAGHAQGRRDDLDPVAPGAAIGAVSDITNLCAVGGNANAWSVHTPVTNRGVRFGRFPQSDLGAAWPVPAPDLEAAYRRAAQIWKINPDGWTPPQAPLATGPDVVSAMFQFADARTLLSDVKTALLSAPKPARFLVNAEAQAIEFSAPGTARRLRIASAPGHTIYVRASEFILTSGCMGVTRLLLNSQTPEGHAPGNAHDQLGRYFMDHPLVDGGLLFPASSHIFEEERAFDLRRDERGVRMAHLHLSASALQREAIPNLSVILLPRRANELGMERRSLRRQRAHKAGLAVREAIERRQLPRLTHIGAALAGSDEMLWRLARLWLKPQANLGRGGWSNGAHPGAEFSAFQVLHQAEQKPDPNNRLTLSDERDALGMRRLAIDWSWSDADKQALERGQAVFAKSFAALGRFEPRRDMSGAPLLMTHSMGHHMGTTRMHADARHGVTDPFGRVHGIQNVHVCSSSLFPSGSYINPTFTILALSVRLAAHLISQRRALAVAA